MNVYYLNDITLAYEDIFCCSRGEGAHQLSLLIRLRLRDKTMTGSGSNKNLVFLMKEVQH